jgi:hypothetical protein
LQSIVNEAFEISWGTSYFASATDSHSTPRNQSTRHNAV